MRAMCRGCGTLLNDSAARRGVAGLVSRRLRSARAGAFLLRIVKVARAFVVVIMAAGNRRGVFGVVRW